MASASVKAMPMNIVVVRVPDISGLRQIACNAPFATMPMPMPGPIAPNPIANAAAMSRKP